MILKRDNVEKVADQESAIAILKKQGYEEVQMEQAEQAPPEDPKTPDLDSMKVNELKELAKVKGIEGCSSLTKAELIAILKDVV